MCGGDKLGALRLLPASSGWHYAPRIMFHIRLESAHLTFGAQRQINALQLKVRRTLTVVLFPLGPLDLASV